ncbi:MAG: hypothetical protein H7Y02_05570 [Candidatus Obscuribacterales bacterium]|nr:hypothetical protein [Steroidobacteraceae bacterium]
MRHPISHRPARSVGTPMYCMETDVSFSRVIRDPMTVLLGRSSLSMQPDAGNADPYNRVGRWMRGRWGR